MNVAPLRGFRATQKRWASLRSPAPALLLAGGALLTAVASPAIAQCQYEVSAIITAPPCPFTGPPPLIGRGMNNAGAVVGYYFDCNSSTVDHAFYWSPNKGLFTLPKPEGVTASWAYDINDAGMIVGQMRFSGIGRKGFVYDLATGKYQILEPVHDGAVAEMLSSANAINNAGLVAGNRTISKPGEPNVYNAVIWDTTTGEVTDLGVMNGPNSGAEDVNSDGDISGWSGTGHTSLDAHAFFWRDGQAVSLGVLPGAIQSAALSVNDWGEVFGRSRVPQKGGGVPLQHTFVWRYDAMTSLGLPKGFNIVLASQSNNARQLVGGLRLLGPPNIDRAFLWQHGQFHDLNELVDAPPGVMTFATTTADTGLIVASGSVQNATSAILLTPKDVPVADLDFNCRVDVLDLLFLLSRWGERSSSADLNTDGIVDIQDLVILLENWT